MYKLKNVVRRASALLGVVGLLAGVGASAVPAFVSADALNPLTERSLSLSSSSPGWAFTDGSGNSTYAGPNTGTNGQKTGNTFSFRTSSDATIKAFTFQYCTIAAGQCISPGDDSPLTGPDDSTHSDLDIHTSSPTEVAGDDYATLSRDGTATGTSTTGSGTASNYGDVSAVPDGGDASPVNSPANGINGNFVVLYGSNATGYVDTYEGGWSMAASSSEEASGTGKNNVITLTTTGSGIHTHLGDYVKIIFFANDDNYITNPGSGAFFVKINDYASSDYQNWLDAWPLSGNHCDSDGTTYDASTPTDPCKANVIDGGVTVANVMNLSIAIQTKVLETMDFSVGTVDPDTLTSTGATGSAFYAATGQTNHGQCDPIQTRLTSTDPENVLYMGDTAGEHSLQTNNTFVTHSYWRLSSNSSGGATVYYAGNTLYNTEGDSIAAIGTTAAGPSLGSPQFGLAIDNDSTAGHFYVNHDNDAELTGGNTTQYDYGVDDVSAANHGALDPTATHGWADYAVGTLNAHDPQLYPLVAMDGSGGTMGSTNYAGGGGVFNPRLDTVAGTTKFAFDPTSQTVPAPIATESSQVVDCVTAKMRYAANIAATTPAGIYTTKINYIASPQY